MASGTVESPWSARRQSRSRGWPAAARAARAVEPADSCLALRSLTRVDTSAADGCSGPREGAGARHRSRAAGGGRRAPALSQRSTLPRRGPRLSRPHCTSGTITTAMARALAVLAAVALWRGCGTRELDPGLCASRFDVQRDKIIRTEESREMGARYLSELDVGARAECLRLCCETDACDVFVYEEKSPGSCYLFACGPPEDFRCKFTAHGNFSSGVLALSRRLAELQDQERAAQRPPMPPAPPVPPAPHMPHPPSRQAQPPRLPAAAPTPAHSNDVRATIATPPPPPAAPAQSPQAPALPHQPSQASRCSRYQFACRSGGECIAVYNACDGVPQCADGSDEAPELFCPTPPAPAPPLLPPQSPARALLPPSSPQEPLPPPRSVAPPKHMQHHTPAPPPSLQENFLVESAEAPAPAPAPAVAVEARWPHRLAQAQQQAHRYSEGVMGGSAVGMEPLGSPQIFSHAGGLVQEAPAMMPAANNWPRRQWPQTGGSEWGGWRGAPVGPLGPMGPMGPMGPDWREEPRWPQPPPQTPLDARTRPVPEAASATRDGDGAGGGEMAEFPSRADGPSRPHDAPKKGPREPPARPAPAPTAAAAPTAPSDRPAPAPKHQEPAMEVHLAAEAAAHADEAEGRSSSPASALLLLALGVAMAATLLAMGACRARASRRRRRQRALAHDADYLVNGMYL